MASPTNDRPPHTSAVRQLAQTQAKPAPNYQITKKARWRSPRSVVLTRCLSRPRMTCKYIVTVHDFQTDGASFWQVCYCSRMDSKDKLIEELRVLIAEQLVRPEEQSAQLEKQSARIRQLELEVTKLKKESSTSSKPPSNDIAKPQRKNSSRK